MPAIALRRTKRDQPLASFCSGGSARQNSTSRRSTKGWRGSTVKAAAAISKTSRPYESCICHSAGLGKPSSVAPWHGCERFHSQPDDPSATARHPANRTSPQTRASPLRECLLLRPLPAISPCPTPPAGHKVSLRRLVTSTGPIYPKSCPDHRLPLHLIAHSAAVTP